MRKRQSDDGYSECRIDRKLNTIYLSGDITTRQAATFRRYIRQLERSTKTIVVEINSEGGEVDAGLAIIDSIELCKRPVTTRVVGQCYSMATAILVAGKLREASPRSTIMLHHGTLSMQTTFTELTNEVQEHFRLDEMTWDYMDDKTGKPRGYWKERCGAKNLYVPAELAIKEGLIHRVCQKGKL